MLQFDVCCKAIDQNFDCGCTSLHSQKVSANLHLLACYKEKFLFIVYVTLHVLHDRDCHNLH